MTDLPINYNRPLIMHIDLNSCFAIIEQQANILLDYEQNWGYCARFAVGLEHAKKLVSWYFDLPYEENGELF